MPAAPSAEGTSAIERARNLGAKERNWREATRILQEAVTDPEDADLQTWAASALIESNAQKEFEKADGALRKSDYREAVNLASK